MIEVSITRSIATLRHYVQAGYDEPGAEISFPT